MPKLKFLYATFILASVFFVAKPFVGFRLSQFLLKSKAHSVCVKCFSKRKPEYLEEATAKKAAFSIKLNNPPAKAQFSILQLLAILFLPVVFWVEAVNAFTNSLYKSRYLYLLTGKLTI